MSKKRSFSNRSFRIYAPEKVKDINEKLTLIKQLSDNIENYVTLEKVEKKIHKAEESPIKDNNLINSLWSDNEIKCLRENLLQF